MAAAVVGATCEAVDGAARAVIAEGGYGDAFIHRTGHGIGLEEHEDPYIVAGNTLPLAPGHAFSVEPGIYLSRPLRGPHRGHRGGRPRRPARTRRLDDRSSHESDRCVRVRRCQRESSR